LVKDNPMRVIPVIDLKGGLVVHGVAGDRAAYRPVVSRIAADPRPATVAAAFVQQLGLREIYVADLDAIAGAEPDWDAYCQIAAAGARLLIDAGLCDAGDAQELTDFADRAGCVTGIIAGLESCRSAADLAAIFGILGQQLGLFSLDLVRGVPRTGISFWRGTPPLEVVQFARQIGFRRIIVLDLADVGVQGGTGTLDLCGQLRAVHPRIELIAGGGVRGADDLRVLSQSGCDAALVASALHNGCIISGDLGLSDGRRDQDLR
jgi:phosphoribosylformimino-5-aminoimidazole carboxamide ribotide isomerase